MVGYILCCFVIGILALSLFVGIIIVIADWFVCRYRKLVLYGYYTNGVDVWKLIQYDSIQATLYDENTETMISMGRNEFIRDFKFLMAGTLSVKHIGQGDEQNGLGV